MPDRAALTGILFVLKSGIPWEMLPPEMGCGSGMTCWRRLRDWQAAGLWVRLHHVLLDQLGAAGHIDWSRVSLDAQAVPAPGTAKRGPVTRRGPLAPTPQTVANRARSAILWPNARASRSPSA